MELPAKIRTPDKGEMMRLVAAAAALTLALAACRTAGPAPAVVTAAPDAVDAATALRYQQLSAALWQQTSAEYRALTSQSFNVARRMLDVALADPQWTAAIEQKGDYSKLPPAIITDVDETLIDTSGYQATLFHANAKHSEERFGAYSATARPPALEGAREFLRYAQSRGVKVFYITNRTKPFEDRVRANLENAGLPLDANEDTVIMRAERPDWDSGDKSPRRAWVAQSHRIVLLLGDDFNDFVTSYGMNVEQRARIFEQVRDNYGTKWIILPNATYGSWERALTAGEKDLTAERELEIKLKQLKSYN